MQKSLLCFLVVTVLAYTKAKGAYVEYVDNLEYSRYTAFPDGEGVMHPVDLEAEPDMNILNEIKRDPANNTYLLFTRRNQKTPQPLSVDHTNSVIYSNFNADIPTMIIAHGWYSNQFDDINHSIRDAVLEKGLANVIVLDWSRLAKTDYATACRGVPIIGRGLAQFLIFLNKETNQAFSQMHLVGFSLGAHLVANAGRELGGKVARITVLDPAGPLWNYNPYRVKPTDAVYVEAIHTDSGYAIGSLGISSNVGHADFYPNGGASQPGCVTNLCNHNRAWELFTATVKYNHLIGRRCTNSIQLTRAYCRGPELRMGNDDLKKTGRGIYLLETGRWYPY